MVLPCRDPTAAELLLAAASFPAWTAWNRIPAYPESEGIYKDHQSNSRLHKGPPKFKPCVQHSGQGVSATVPRIHLQERCPAQRVWSAYCD